MQGTAADIIKRAMIDIDAWLHEVDAPVLMIMQVHDELVFEVDEGVIDQYATQIAMRMESVVELSVPLVAASGIGDNWDEAH
jgi:DNA polymerase-1